MAETPKKRKEPKRATDRRRTYAATIGAQAVDLTSASDGNGAARAFSIFNDRRVQAAKKTNLGVGKRAS